MVPVAILAMFTLIQTPAPAIDAEQFLHLIRGLQADYKDVSFVYEGTFTEITTVLVVGSSEKTTASHQGHFVYRSDGAFLRDSYGRSLTKNDEGSILRKTDALLGDRMTRLERMLDYRPVPPRVGKPAPEILRDYHSPGRILWIWYFQALDDPAGLHYEFQGWEVVDGHRCLRIQLDRRRGSETWKYRFWIDVERGGHPLRVEQVKDGEVRLRTDQIRLDLLPTEDGKELWLPVRGRTRQFSDTKGSGETYRRPTVRDDCSIAFGTVRINAGLGDEVFSVDWEGDLPSTAELSELRKKADEPFVIRTDARFVREELDRMLAKADSKSERLEASSPARRRWRSGTLVQLGFAAFGVLLLAGAAFRRRAAR